MWNHFHHRHSNLRKTKESLGKTDNIMWCISPCLREVEMHLQPLLCSRSYLLVLTGVLGSPVLELSSSDRWVSPSTCFLRRYLVLCSRSSSRWWKAGEKSLVWVAGNTSFRQGLARDGGTRHGDVRRDWEGFCSVLFLKKKKKIWSK